MTYQIYKILRQQSLSGDEIGSRLSISRAAVNKHIMKLRVKGVDIQSFKGKGYKWLGDCEVNEYSLKYELELLNIDIAVHYEECESTNIEAKKYAMQDNCDSVSVAPFQRSGRGRMKREFISKKGGGYFSLVVNDTGLPLSTIMRVVLLAGLSVRDVLEDMGIRSSLKWPNDVYVGDRKISGILMELITSCGNADKVIIGIGINIDNELPDDLDRIATRVCDNTNNDYSISNIIARVVKRLYYYIGRLKDDNWEEISKLYKSISYTIGKRVTYNGVTGMAKDITSEGFLVIDIDGKDTKIVTGDVVVC